MSWKHSLNQYDVAITISTAVQCISFIHNAALLIYHIFSTYHAYSDRNKTLKTSYRMRGIHQLTFFTMFLLTIQRIPVILNELDMTPRSISCKHWLWLQSISLFFTKTATHVLFIERLYAIFYKSAFEFRVSTVYLTRVYLAIYFVFESSLSCIFNDSLYINGQCSSRLPMCVIGIIAVCDFSTGIFLSNVFTRKLLWFSTFAVEALGMTHQQYRNSRTDSRLEQDKEPRPNENDDVSDLLNLLRKVTLLALIVIFTTLSMYVFIAFFELYALWLSIDAMINQWCIVLMYRAHDKLYLCLCNKPESALISMRCLQCYSCRQHKTEDTEQASERKKSSSELQTSDSKTDCALEIEAAATTK
eukprot:202120_1